MMKQIRILIRLLKNIIIIFVKTYKLLISPYLGNNCRYVPSCSDYMLEAIHKKGTFLGIFYGLKRLMRCNPWGGSGYDPLEVSKKKFDKENC